MNGVDTFPNFYHGATALMANYRCQTGEHQAPNVSSGQTLTQIPGKWSWLNALTPIFV